jgi:hypothetical protein
MARIEFDERTRDSPHTTSLALLGDSSIPDLDVLDDQPARKRLLLAPLLFRLLILLLFSDNGLLVVLLLGSGDGGGRSSLDLLLLLGLLVTRLFGRGGFFGFAFLGLRGSYNGGGGDLFGLLLLGSFGDLLESAACRRLNP